MFNLFKKKKLSQYEYNKLYCQDIITTLDGSASRHIGYSSRYIDSIGFFFLIEIPRIKDATVTVLDDVLYISGTKKEIDKNLINLFKLKEKMKEAKGRCNSTCCSLASMDKKFNFQYQMNKYQLSKIDINDIQQGIRDGVLNIYIKEKEGLDEISI